MKTVIIIIGIILVILTISGCAAGPNPMADTPNEDGEVAGFWQGVWNGFISPFTFIISLFSDSVTVYEVHNNGGWYNFGFVIGATSSGGSGGAATSGGSGTVPAP